MLKACLLALAVSVDTFFAAMGCSISGIRITRRCVVIVSVIGCMFMGVALLSSQVLSRLLPEPLYRYGGAAVLCLIGISQLMKEGLRALFRARKPHVKRRALGLVIEICFDETKADMDGSKELNLGEMLSLAVVLSLDAFASGLTAGIAPEWCLLCVGLTFLLGFVLTMLGAFLGKRCARRRMQWIGGIMLLLLAGCRIVFG